jgi:5-methyltetrahydrofolate--homocysteine methyltransferase
VEETALDVAEVFDWLDEFVVVRSRWAFSRGALEEDAFRRILAEKAEPLLEAWKGRILEGGLLEPRALRGYFPVRARGDRLEVHAPDRSRILSEFRFPRQAEGRRQCIADFYQEDEFDVLPLLVVTLGPRAADTATELYKDNHYADYFQFHGLATELTEACAELVHARIRRELGIHGRDARERRQIFSQGYQGSRYAFGYPACPDLEGNGPLLQLLEAGSIGVTLTETFLMVPEFTTSALVAWHPQARYFSV